MTTSVFHVEHANRWLPLLEVAQQDWDRLSSTFSSPRKLFLFVLGCYAGCEGTFRYAPNAASDIADSSVRESTENLYFFPSSPVRPLPARTWRKPASSSGMGSASTRNSGTTGPAKQRDEDSCVITGNARYIRVAHVLPKAYTDLEIQELNDSRAVLPNDHLEDGEGIRNKITILSNAHDDYDEGKICFLRVPNWSFGRNEVHTMPPVASLARSGEVHPTTISAQRAVLYVDVAPPDPQINWPTGRICRLSHTSRYPPSWVLDIGVARSFLITFGVSDTYTAISSLNEDEAQQVSNPAANAGVPDLDTSLDTDLSVDQSPKEKGPTTRSRRRRNESQQRKMQVDEFLLGQLRKQPRFASRFTDGAYSSEEEEEPLPAVDIDAWLAKLSLDNAGS